MTERMRVVVTATADGEFQSADHAENFGTKIVELIEEWDTSDGIDVDMDVTPIEDLPYEVAGAPSMDIWTKAHADAEAKLVAVRMACSELKKLAPHPTGLTGENATFFAWAKIAEALQEEIP